MKKIFLFGSHLWLYLTEIPVIFLLCVVISIHDTGPAIVKFYPLEIALGSLAVFIVIFFFRGVIISKDEIRQVGRFTPRYKSMIEEGKTLVFTLFSKNNLTVELYERDDAAPSLPWAGDVAGEINLFRARTIGNHRAVRRTLILFGLTGEEADALISEPPTKEISFENVAVRTEEKHDAFIYYIRLLNTL